MGFVEQGLALEADVSEVAAGGEKLPVLVVDGADEVRQGIEIHLVEDRLLCIEQARVGVVDEGCGVVRGETVEDLHGHKSSDLGGEEDLGPVGAALGVDYDFVAFLEACRFPAEHQFFDICSELAIGDTATVVVVESLLVPALLDRIFKCKDEIVFLFEFVHL